MTASKKDREIPFESAPLWWVEWNFPAPPPGASERAPPPLPAPHAPQHDPTGVRQEPPEQSEVVKMNGSRPACLYSDPSVFVKTEFDTGEIYIGEKEREGECMRVMCGKRYKQTCADF